ncbi:hypothetical protein KEM52_001204 [Ascosphaera acerosa]|nr:hypothetical protein KEM52_001204 [Ascosphaera acerosa]
MVDQQIFQSLQAKLDQEAEVRDALSGAVQAMARSNRAVQAVLARAHSTPADQLAPTLEQVKADILRQREDVSVLRAVADTQPFYQFNYTWTRELQDMIFGILFCSWLGGLAEHRATSAGEPASGAGGGVAPVPEAGYLMSMKEVGDFLGVEVEGDPALKESPGLHITIEEYLFALIALVDELSRLAINSVTLGDYARPLVISRFIGQIHAGFQLLNLKNGALRQRSDSLKYAVKRVESVVYDLSLRKLIPGTVATGAV